MVGTGFTRANPPRIRKVDVTDFRALEELITEVNPSVVVHWYRYHKILFMTVLRNEVLMSLIILRRESMWNA